MSGTSSSGMHHTGLLEGWFGDHWWSARTFVLLITTIFVFAPLTCLKHIGLFHQLSQNLIHMITIPSVQQRPKCQKSVYSTKSNLLNADSLRYTSALSVALAIVFVVVTAGITIFKLCTGTIEMPRLFPQITDLASVWNLFTSVPVIVTAYICHYNRTFLSSLLSSSNCLETLMHCINSRHYTVPSIPRLLM